MDRRPARRRISSAARRPEVGRRRRTDVDAYYRAEHDLDVYRPDAFDPGGPLEPLRQLA